MIFLLENVLPLTDLWTYGLDLYRQCSSVYRSECMLHAAAAAADECTQLQLENYLFRLFKKYEEKHPKTDVAVVLLQRQWRNMNSFLFA